MLTVDISLAESRSFTELVTTESKKGFLTYDEIVSGLEEVDLTKEQVEDFYSVSDRPLASSWWRASHKHPPHERAALAQEEKGPKRDRPSSRPRLAAALPRVIGQVPLLTATKVYLATRIERGDMSAKTQMIEANLRLVVSIAKSYLGRGLSFLQPDRGRLLGLIARGRRASTTARATSSPPTRRGGSAGRDRAIADKARTIRIPVHMVEKLNKVVHIERQPSSASAASRGPTRSPRSSR